MSRSKELAGKTMFRAFQLLSEAGGELPVKELIKGIEGSVEFNEWEKGKYEKTGNIRWISNFYLFSIDCVKAGYLRKSKGIWTLTEEGEKAISLGETQLLESAIEAYRNWKKENAPDPIDDEGIEEDDDPLVFQTLDEIEQQASDSIKAHVLAKNAYEFQDLVAALLRGMGYFTPHVSPPGKDGGIDVIAYQDPLGTKSPRIRVQVKHRENTKASVEEIRQLKGVLMNSNDIGLFVSIGDFTSDAKTEARNGQVHIELINFDRFISMWTEFYHKMDDNDKGLLPLKTIYFHTPST